MAELADAHDSKSCGAIRAGSSPAIGSKNPDYICNLDFSVFGSMAKLEEILEKRRRTNRSIVPRTNNDRK